MLINNGYKRGSKIIVEKYINDVSVSGYPKTYDAKVSFDNYNALSQAQFAELSLLAFTDRMDAFEAYIEGEEAGASFANSLVAGFERRIYDNITCQRGW